MGLVIAHIIAAILGVSIGEMIWTRDQVGCGLIGLVLCTVAGGLVGAISEILIFHLAWKYNWSDSTLGAVFWIVIAGGLTIGFLAGLALMRWSINQPEEEMS